jgi:retinol dehydrogenase-12
MRYFQHTEGRVTTLLLITLGWLALVACTPVLRTVYALPSAAVALALLATMRFIAGGPSAHGLPDGAASPLMFRGRPLSARPYAGDRVAVVTGANRGIGLETVKSLCLLGARVVMVDVEPDAATEVVKAAIRSGDPEASLASVRLDISDFDAIKGGAAAIVSAAKELLASASSKATTTSPRAQPIWLLVNNAGMAQTAREFTRYGFDRVFSVNALGPYLLTEHLLPFIADRIGRVVNTASVAHTWWHKYPLSDDAARCVVRHLELTNDPSVVDFPSNGSYGLSKFVNLVHAALLAKRLAARGITTASLHPGAVFSDIWRFIPYPLKYLSDAIMALLFKSTYDGHQTTLHVATTSQLLSGAYYADCAPFRPRDEARDERVWDAVDEWQRSVLKKWLKNAA